MTIHTISQSTIRFIPILIIELGSMMQPRISQTHEFDPVPRH